MLAHLHCWGAYWPHSNPGPCWTDCAWQWPLAAIWRTAPSRKPRKGCSLEGDSVCACGNLGDEGDQGVPATELGREVWSEVGTFQLGPALPAAKSLELFLLVSSGISPCSSHLPGWAWLCLRGPYTSQPQSPHDGLSDIAQSDGPGWEAQSLSSRSLRFPIFEMRGLG